MGEESYWRFCVVGNIVKTHADEEGITRYGTKAFTGGTKVYMPGRRWEEDWDGILAIGRNRFGRYALEDVPLELLENIRFQIVFKTPVLNIILGEEAVDGWDCWGRTAADKREAKAFAARLAEIVEKRKQHTADNTTL